MKLLITYLRQNRSRIMLYCAFLIIFISVFILYRLPLLAVLYPGILCSVLGTLHGVYDFIKFRRKHKELSKIIVCREGLAASLPSYDDLISSDYAAVIALLQDELTRQKADFDNATDETVSYYTIWAHQIKTPIAAIRLALQNDDSPLSLRLGGEISRIEQYVEMVLGYLRLGSSTTDFVFAKCDLDTVLRSSIKRFSTEFIDRRIALNFTPTGRELITDSKWLQFVTEQIISNALKYTPKGSIDIYADADYLYIKDTGIGISPSDLPRVFDKGYTGYNGRTDTKASGIGLYLCKRICDALGIEIHIDSVVAQGTTVRLSLSQIVTKMQ